MTNIYALGELTIFSKLNQASSFFIKLSTRHHDSLKAVGCCTVQMITYHQLYIVLVVLHNRQTVQQWISSVIAPGTFSCNLNNISFIYMLVLVVLA